MVRLLFGLIIRDTQVGMKFFRREVLEKVIPEKGFQSKIALKDSAVQLTENGVIDREKFAAIYHLYYLKFPEKKDPADLNINILRSIYDNKVIY